MAPGTELSISVALCTYNGEAYVHEQLASIAAQTVPAGEVIICDDGSTDGTIRAVEDFIAAHAGPTAFRIAHTDRAGGVRANFARAIEACEGDLIALCDQDDVWREDRLAFASATLDSHPSLLAVHTDARIVDDAGAQTGDTLLDSLSVGARERESIHAGLGMQVLIRRNIVTGATLMFRRELLASALPLGENWVHDEWLAVIAASLGGLDLIEDQLIDYRVHGANVIGVAQPTLRNRLRQLRVPRADRYPRFAVRAQELADRLDHIGAPQETQLLAQNKRNFELRRAAYPAGRLRRIRPVLLNAARGGYATLSSQGRADIVRDLIQPE
jgi:glycosyltransferase involved in cell wall biosynthesis